MSSSDSTAKKPTTRSNSDTQSRLDNIANTLADAGNTSGELRANFASTDESSKSKSHSEDKKLQSSPLLSSTPPVVSKALVRAYPYLLIINKLLAIATWTNEDYWVNIVLVSLYAFAVLYFENLVTWFGHLIIVGVITLFALLNEKIIEETKVSPTLDDVVHALTATCIKADMLIFPITSLSLTAYDIKRLLFTTLFLTPIYLIITFLLIKPRIVLLFTGLFLLTYHSSYSVVIRRIVWKIKAARVISFYLTGLDLSQSRKNSLFAAAFAKVQKNENVDNPSNKPVRFTYVIYENQRRWLGIGWTSNLLSYERTPWTDEFLNESSSIDTFKLPNAATDDTNLSSDPNLQGATWRWVDKTWRLDLTNDGAITLPSSKRSKTTANPSTDEGYIYYDNVWKKPSTEDTFSKYTRRRRWIRTAELIYSNNTNTNTNTKASTIEENLETITDSVKSTGVDTQATSPSRTKNLRFAEEPESKETNASEAVEVTDKKSI
ncbi:Integral peroxisomal membrane peroxin family protein [Candida parapsilosis]|uniref:Peroxin/Ferlin domain-containing protein n=2 Tax=Candida parapsilosis TaxID=5480 RepID=G8BES7_CANPC|nr:uncharacterized protein CPAR2_213590 [Candida parapsilosis]KAF6054135.1 Integral peroxisomal membrane peroxin family protein [Candida parapsilosis]KAF6056841.1 Integral peroxisomal membrane peroxin family protein [Candida parapsilosis]KAF6059776.1 Integral peroxisomal membrane peroxin family protein [Candida parapsilosis]KAF6068529.1 Integral peroxisomal membrane peroxin family protein [Candida parapsilosis]KAI5902063.1 Peroxisomal membrane protein PEX30 [Candida parapsilosis]